MKNKTWPMWERWWKCYPPRPIAPAELDYIESLNEAFPPNKAKYENQPDYDKKIRRFIFISRERQAGSTYREIREKMISLGLGSYQSTTEYSGLRAIRSLIKRAKLQCTLINQMSL